MHKKVSIFWEKTFFFTKNKKIFRRDFGDSKFFFPQNKVPSHAPLRPETSKENEPRVGILLLQGLERLGAAA